MIEENSDALQLSSVPNRLGRQLLAATLRRGDTLRAEAEVKVGHGRDLTSVSRPLSLLRDR